MLEIFAPRSARPLCLQCFAFPLPGQIARRGRWQDVRSGQPAITRGLDRLDALCRGRRQPVKGLDRLSGEWREIKRAPIALDRLPPPARLHPSDQGPRQGRAPLRLLHPLKIQKEALFRNFPSAGLRPPESTRQQTESYEANQHWRTILLRV